MAEALVTATTYRVTFLSPVHVGAGERLGHHDVLPLRGRLYRIAPDRLLAELERDPQARDRYLTGGLPQIMQWLQQRDRLRGLALYECDVPRDPRPREDVHTFLTDPLNRPYVPGTELKGAIRTAVLWQLVTGHPDRQRLAAIVGKKQNRAGQVEDERDRRHAGRWLEQTLLGQDPRDDVFRLLRISDSSPAPAASLRVCPVVVAARQNDGFRLMERPRGRQIPSSYTDRVDRAVAIFCECLDAREVQTRVELDQFLLRKWERDAGFLPRWPEACNAFSGWVAQAERTWWDQAWNSSPPSLRPLATTMAQFYAQLLRRVEGLPAGHAVLNLGWGGGWRAKTVAEQFGDQTVHDLVRRYKLDRESRSRPFPKTRRVAWLGADRFAPLGWVLLVPNR